MSYVRTPEHRELRTQLIQSWKAWEKSTGPKTTEGKRRSAMRGYKGGQRGQAMDIARLLAVAVAELAEHDRLLS